MTLFFSRFCDIIGGCFAGFARCCFAVSKVLQSENVEVSEMESGSSKVIQSENKEVSEIDSMSMFGSDLMDFATKDSTGNRESQVFIIRVNVLTWLEGSFFSKGFVQISTFHLFHQFFLLELEGAFSLKFPPFSN